MGYYEQLREHAKCTYYFVSTNDADELNIPKIELAKMAHRGKLTHLSYGLYRITNHENSDYDRYMMAVKATGPEAFLYGESVLALLGYIDEQDIITVATTKRIRKILFENVKLIKLVVEPKIETYEAIRCQNLADAFRVCASTIDKSALVQMLDDAKSKKIISGKDYRSIYESL